MKRRAFGMVQENSLIVPNQNNIEIPLELT